MSTEALPSAGLTLEEIVEKDPSTALYLPVAERLLARGQIAEAIRLCEERRSRPGKGVGDHIVTGRCYLADGRLAEARGEFQQALQLDRENVVALKSMAGILSHDGRHAEASDLYRAVCRVDPGDLESQSALHQITSGEYAEVRPPELIVSQGERSWQPIRLTREEDHLRELALGLPTFETFEASEAVAKGPVPPTDEPSTTEAILTPDELTIGPSFPSERVSLERSVSARPGAPASPVPPSRHEIVVPAGGFPEGGLHNRLGSLDVEEFQTSALERLDQVLRPAAVRPLGEVESPAPPPPVELPDSALVDTPRPSSTRSAVWDDEPAAPAGTERAASPAPAELPATPKQAAEPAALTPPAAPAPAAAAPTVEGNRAAFETWLRRLGGKS
ncbi:MAG TPA: tetratricopeptide repeat protein [Candidatus Eisenbacteria bacterium]|nr:tetratricopeptide repeat protein [Candidatus Eisenbacteria bacterium]